MKHDVSRFTAWASFLLTLAIPMQLYGATAPHKAVYTFGGLNERSGLISSSFHFPLWPF